MRVGMAYQSIFVFTTMTLVMICVAQQEILGISSFNFCENISPLLNNNGTGKIPEYLNCLTEGGETITITTIDLRLVASGTTKTFFDIDLTTVPDEGADRTNQDGTKCNADGAGYENCVVTTPAKISIESTKYIYYYRLRVASDIAPQYCYVAKFDAISSDNMYLQGGGEIHTHETDVCMETINVEYCTTARETNNCQTTEDLFENPVDIALNTFADNTQRIKYKYTNNDANCLNTNKCANCDNTFCTPENTRGTCRNTIFSFDSIRKGGSYFDQSGNSNVPDLGLPDSFFQCLLNYTEHDDMPVISSYPISDPPPLKLSSKVNTAYGNVLQDITCSGYNCGGIYDALCPYGFATSNDLEKQQLPNSPLCQNNAKDGATGSKNQVGPIGMNLGIYSLNPNCILYEIDEIPGVLVTVRFKVTTDTNGDGLVDDQDTDIYVDSNGIESVQEFKLTNILGLEKVSSSQGVAGARVVSVDTLDGYIGPAIPGFIVMCGDPDPPIENLRKNNIYTDPKIQAAENPQSDGLINTDDDTGVNVLASLYNQLDPNGDGILESTFIDMHHYVLADEYSTNQSLYDPTVNPWPIIAEGLNKTVMYPRGENLNYAPPSLNRPKRNAMWYYIPIEKESWIGKGCNQLGLTDLFWNTNFQGGAPNVNTGIEQCYLSPFTCVPGYNENSFGGRSIPGCLASAAFVAKEENSISPTQQMRDNQNEIDYVIKNSMPPQYNEANPNFWTLALTDGMALAYDPSICGTNCQGNPPELSFEVLIDLVGTFVAYESTVPNGIIVQPIICNGTIGVPSTGNMTVGNRGTIPGSFQVQIQCVSGLIAIDNNGLLFKDLEPGEDRSQIFEYTPTIDTENIDNPCLARLLPSGGDVFVILQEVSFSCTDTAPITKPDDPTEQENPNDINVVPCGCMDMPCWEQTDGVSKWDSICYNLFIWPPLILLILFLGASGYFIVIKIRAEKLSRESDKDIDNTYAKTMKSTKQNAGDPVGNKKEN
jgi:hypothetical protein